MMNPISLGEGIFCFGNANFSYDLSISNELIASSASLSWRFLWRTNFPTFFVIWYPNVFTFSFREMECGHRIEYTEVPSGSSGAPHQFPACFHNQLPQDFLENILDPCIVTHPRSDLTLGIWPPKPWCHLQDVGRIWISIPWTSRWQKVLTSRTGPISVSF